MLSAVAIASGFFVYFSQSSKSRSDIDFHYNQMESHYHTVVAMKYDISPLGNTEAYYSPWPDSPYTYLWDNTRGIVLCYDRQTWLHVGFIDSTGLHQWNHLSHAQACAGVEFFEGIVYGKTQIFLLSGNQTLKPRVIFTIKPGEKVIRAYWMNFRGDKKSNTASFDIETTLRSLEVDMAGHIVASVPVKHRSHVFQPMHSPRESYLADLPTPPGIFNPANWPRFTIWALSVVSLFLSLILSQRLDFSRKSKILWALGPLLMLALYPWPTLEICDHCGKKRLVTHETCEHCGAGWAAPKNETEVFEISNYTECPSSASSSEREDW
jgi:hypothetical protein